MKIFLAGAVTGNLIKNFKLSMEIYLEQAASDSRIEYNEKMKIFIASIGNGHGGIGAKQKIIPLNQVYALESFYYISKEEWMFPLLKEFKGFLLDSGAFTFMSSKKNSSVDWDKYIETYGEFIKRHNVDNFFELDIDVIVGLTEVERLRAKLEKITNKRCIPVWHKSRGLEYFKKMCSDYSYVAVGGIVTQEIKRTEYPVFSNLLSIANKNNCRVHGLGFTNLEGMAKYRFHSVDSTAWLSGNKFGHVYLFNGRTMDKVQRKKGQKVKGNEVAFHNFSEWIKFSKYAEEYL